MDRENNWKHCKIVEQKETGEIILHEKNLEVLFDTWAEVINKVDPITLVSFVGPQSCGKSFFSNLFIEYVRMSSSLSWTKRIKREGLQGFSYGVESDAQNLGLLTPEKNINAIYFYPEILKLHVHRMEEFICILHVHRGNRKTMNRENDIALDVVLAMMSSVLVNVVWKDKNTLFDIYELGTSSSYLPVKNYLTKNVIHVLRGAGERENENVIQLDESASLHDDKGLVKLSFQQYSALNNLMKAISTFQNVKQAQATLSNILGRFKENITIINVINGFDTPLRLSALQPGKVLTFEGETKTVQECTLETEKNRKIKRELPTLLYQIALSRIGIATLSKNSWKSNSGTISIQSHTGEVGILLDGKWVCGNDVRELNNQGKVRKFWLFESIFSSYDFNDTFDINKEQLCITLPFLVGVFFGLMKQKAENEHNGQIKAALISVPFWFSSHKRRQIVEAGSIAGFDNVQLINENTASAYFAYANGLCPSSQQMIVISENSNKVDISIYSYDQKSKIVYMTGQSGDYETSELPNDKRFVRKFVTGTLAYLLSNQQEKGIKEKALESLDTFWRLAKSRLKTSLSPVNRTVLICCESDHWREFLYTFAGKITRSENISVRNDSPLLGLASLFQAFALAKTGSVESFFKDAIPFNVILMNGNQKFPFRIKDSTFCNSETRQISLELPKDFDCLTFNEEGLALERFGTFYLKSKPPKLFSIKAALDRSRNGVFNLTAINYAEGVTYEWPGLRKPLPKYCYEWHPCKTTDETLATYRSLMDQINLQTKASGQVEDMQKPTEEKAVKIKEAIKACTDKFKSSLGKNMVIRQIDEIIEALKQPGMQGKVLKKHASYLDDIVKKYDLQI